MLWMYYDTQLAGNFLADQKQSGFCYSRPMTNGTHHTSIVVIKSELIVTNTLIKNANKT